MIWYYCNIHELHVTSYVLMHFLLSLPFLLPFFFFFLFLHYLSYGYVEKTKYGLQLPYFHRRSSLEDFTLYSLCLTSLLHVFMWFDDLATFFLYTHRSIVKSIDILLDKAPSLTLAQQWSFNIKWLHLTSSLSSIRRSEEGITLLQCHKALFPFGRFGRKQWTYNRRSEKCCSKAILTSR